MRRIDHALAALLCVAALTCSSSTASATSDYYGYDRRSHTLEDTLGPVACGALTFRADGSSVTVTTSERGEVRVFYLPVGVAALNRGPNLTLAVQTVDAGEWVVPCDSEALPESAYPLGVTFAGSAHLLQDEAFANADAVLTSGGSGSAPAWLPRPWRALPAPVESVSDTETAVLCSEGLLTRAETRQNDPWAWFYAGVCLHRVGEDAASEAALDRAFEATEGPIRLTMVAHAEPWVGSERADDEFELGLRELAELGVSPQEAWACSHGAWIVGPVSPGWDRTAEAPHSLRRAARLLHLCEGAHGVPEHAMVVARRFASHEGAEELAASAAAARAYRPADWPYAGDPRRGVLALLRSLPRWPLLLMFAIGVPLRLCGFASRAWFAQGFVVSLVLFLFGAGVEFGRSASPDNLDAFVRHHDAAVFGVEPTTAFQRAEQLPEGIEEACSAFDWSSAATRRCVGSYSASSPMTGHTEPAGRAVGWALVAGFAALVLAVARRDDGARSARLARLPLVSAYGPWFAFDALALSAVCASLRFAGAALRDVDPVLARSLQVGWLGPISDGYSRVCAVAAYAAVAGVAVALLAWRRRAVGQPGRGPHIE